MSDQAIAVSQADWDWIVICDGGRADVFEGLAEDYFPDAEHYRRVWNGDVAFTANWFDRTFDGEYDAALFHGGQPIYSFRENPPGYDEREHFRFVADWEEYEWGAVAPQTCAPESVTEVVRSHLDHVDRGVIRYVQPHNPYRSLPPITGLRDAEQFSATQLRRAYRDNYQWVLDEIAEELLPALDGRVVITADHGQCFGDCGQYLHATGHDAHDHLAEVPWLVTQA